MSAPLAVPLANVALGIGSGVATNFLMDWIPRNLSKPGQKPNQKPKDILETSLADLGPKTTVKQLLEMGPLFRGISEGNITSIQDLEARSAQIKEQLRQQGAKFDLDTLTQGREAASSIGQREADNAVERTIRDRGGSVVDATNRLEDARFNRDKALQNENYLRTMGILGHGGQQFQGALDAIIKAGSEDQERQMDFAREVYDRERADRNSPLNMIGRIAGIALPALALFGR